MADAAEELVETLNDWPFPALSPEDWQLRLGSYVIAQRKVRVTLDGWDASMKLDEKSGPGANGASLTFQGYELAKGSIRLECWDQDGWDVIMAVIELVRPRRNDKTPTPFQVYHPALSVLAIDRIFVTKVRAPQYAGQLLSVTLECIEFAPPPAKTAKAATKPLKAADVPDVFSKSTEGAAIGPPLPAPSATKPLP